MSPYATAAPAARRPVPYSRATMAMVAAAALEALVDAALLEAACTPVADAEVLAEELVVAGAVYLEGSR